MPEFVLNAANARADYDSLDDFAKGFIEAMFFAEQSPAYDSEEWFSEECQNAIRDGQSDGTIPGDLSVGDIHPDSIVAIRGFCEEFRRANADLIAEACERDGYDESRAGNDFYFTYCGHGVGYWDRMELEADGLGDRLSAAAGRGEVVSFFGNHVDYGDAPFVHVDLY